MVFGKAVRGDGEHMPTHHFEVAIQPADERVRPIDVGIRIDGDSVVVELPHELVGAYLIG